MVDRNSSNAEKVLLFQALFKGREDVFARRFENQKTGRSGYAPMCANQWGLNCALRRHGRCSDCAAREFVPYSAETVRWHLRGKDNALKPFVMGVYPMSVDETVRFAVIDLDESPWRRDALWIVGKSRELGLSVAIEKSRSGQGAHLWYFMSAPVKAKAILEVLTYVLTLVLEEHAEAGLDSYDRILPNQDTLPKGGFGNLIALPLQAEPRKLDDSVFVNDDWVAFADQWSYLSGVRLNEVVEVETLLNRARAEHRMLLPRGTEGEGNSRPWEFFLPLWSTADPPRPTIRSASEATVRVVWSNRVYVEQANLTPKLRSELIALASFVNPQFYEKQRMKLSVYGNRG